MKKGFQNGNLLITTAFQDEQHLTHSEESNKYLFGILFCLHIFCYFYSTESNVIDIFYCLNANVISYFNFKDWKICLSFEGYKVFQIFIVQIQAL